MNGEITFRAVLGSGFLAVLGITLYHRLTSWASRERLDRRQEIGIVATAPASELLSRVITRCAARHPNVHVLVEELPTPLQRPKLARGEIDLGLAHAFPTLGRTKGDGIVALTVHEDRLDSALVAANHPLAGRRHIEARELADFPFLFMERSFHPGFYDRTHATLEGLGLVPARRGDVRRFAGGVEPRRPGQGLGAGIPVAAGPPAGRDGRRADPRV